MIKIDKKTIKEVEKQLGVYHKKAPVAIYRALNRAAMSARTAATRKPREEYNVKAKDIRETIEIKKANKNNLGTLVRSTGKRLGLEKFKISPRKPRPKKPPILKASVKKDGLKKVPGAFTAEMNKSEDGSNIMVFERTTKKRLPIRRLYGPAVPQMLKNESVTGFIESEIKKTFDKRLEHEINRIIERGKK